jgi:hypothetical protein
MSEARPTTANSAVRCRCCCQEPMKLMRTIPKLGGMPALQVFFCERCSHVETFERDAA